MKKTLYKCLIGWGYLNFLWSITAKYQKTSFTKLMKLATSDVEFSFNNDIYSQIDGVAMKSPFGPTH